MRTKINPNRMELLKLRKTKIIAQRGHSLLQDKLEKLISEFHKLVSIFRRKYKKWDEEFGEFLQLLCILKIQNPSFFENLPSSIVSVDIELESTRLLNLKLYKFVPKNVEQDVYFPSERPPLWDEVNVCRKEIIEGLFEMLNIFISLKLISEEIHKTRRRVNALEYILIPRIQESIKFIESKLTELEREFLMRLLRIKDLIRK